MVRPFKLGRKLGHFQSEPARERLASIGFYARFRPQAQRSIRNHFRRARPDNIIPTALSGRTLAWPVNSVRSPCNANQSPRHGGSLRICLKHLGLGATGTPLSVNGGSDGAKLPFKSRARWSGRPQVVQPFNGNSGSSP